MHSIGCSDVALVTGWPYLGGGHTSKEKYTDSVYIEPNQKSVLYLPSMQDFASLHAIVSKWKPSETDKEGFHQQVLR